eukprot:NODE_1275_length_1207_cov_32.353195_g1044_i0.p1 GENE.NODE_1275_length_1207_cov_32.353195_g1044_i0~~NODE_1275_length_1207_cov_32.353195_g1044_i0.p1  ORF type:complete len:375 (+),score=6.00 NODE_1275_length_1207_cov_32.353195_g1044_i0:39-1127(+)
MEIISDEDEFDATFTINQPQKNTPPPIPKKPKKKQDLMWVEKYRPDSLQQVLSHENILNIISKLAKENKLPHLLFYGPAGTGKTSTILAVAKEIYGIKNYKRQVMELNASDKRGIDVVRNSIKDFASTKLFTKGFKLIILDEADHLTKTAQNSLRRVIEKFTKNTRFCLICNYANKIIPAIQSRCTRFRFGPLKKSIVIKRLAEIAKEENVNFKKDGLSAIYRLSGGDMRKCLNILQSTHLSFDLVNEMNVYLCTGNPLRTDIKKIITWMFNESFKVAFQNIKKLNTDRGYAIADIIRDVYQYVLKVDIPEESKMFLLEKLADIEYYVSFGTSEVIQLSAVISAFQIVKESIARKKPLSQLI